MASRKTTGTTTGVKDTPKAVRESQKRARKTSDEASGTRAVCCALSSEVGNKLRRLAGAPPLTKRNGKPITMFLRLPAPIYAKLRKLATDHPKRSGSITSMTSVLTQLIEKAKEPKNPERSTMREVASELIRSAGTG